MNHTKNNNHSGCCGSKHQDHSKPEKERNGCCDGNQDQEIPEMNKTEKQEGCCSNKN